MGFAPYKPLPCLVSLFSFGNGIDFALHQPDALSPGYRDPVTKQYWDQGGLSIIQCVSGDYLDTRDTLKLALNFLFHSKVYLPLIHYVCTF